MKNKAPDTMSAESYQEMVSQAVETWKAKSLQDGTFTAKVHTFLNENLENVVLSLLGFELRYGGNWEVDHCNGRNGESAAGDFLRVLVQDSIEEWFKANVGTLPKLPTSAVKSIKKDYLELLERRIREGLRNAAEVEAQRQVAAILESSVNSL